MKRLTFSGNWDAMEYEYKNVPGSEMPQLLTTGKTISIPCKSTITIKPDKVLFSFNLTEAMVVGQKPENRIAKGSIASDNPIVFCNGQWLNIQFIGKYYYGDKFEELYLSLHVESGQFSITACWPHSRWKGDYKDIKSENNLFYLNETSKQKYLEYADKVGKNESDAC